MPTRLKKRGKPLAVIAMAVMLIFAASAQAQTGGAAPPPDPSVPAPTPAAPTGVPGKARLLADGSALAPSNAPPVVLNAIAAGNQIRFKPYIWGGGHASFTAAGYDCSGAVSYMLHGGGLLTSPMPSGPFMRWQLAGRGAWITTYSNRGHMYAVVAGLRFDTSAYGFGGKGPRWRATKRPARGFIARHPAGY